MMADNRAYLLDAIRGASAVLIVFYHMPAIVPELYAPSGYMAVDIFFMLSGYVVSMAYGDRLMSGQMSLKTFLLVRAIRLYPLYLMGLALGMGRMAGLHMSGADDALTISQTLTQLVANLFYLPGPPVASDTKLFPINGPNWSLMSEAFINIVFVLGLFRLTNRKIAWLCLAGYVGVVVTTVLVGNLNTGWSWDSAAIALGGFPRVIFAFTVGMLLHRFLGARAQRRKTTWFSVVLLLATLPLLCFNAGTGTFRIAYDLMTVGLLLPALLAASIQTELPRVLRPVAAYLGDVSYAVYIVHYPLIGPVNFALEQFSVPRGLRAVLILVVIFGVAQIALMLDRIIRQKLNARLVARRAKTAAAGT